MPDLFLVRHAEPVLRGVMLGQCDPPLSERGREQAAALLQNVTLAIVYTSPLKRAVETAKLLARGAPIEIIDDLKELSHGEWDGRTWEEIEKLYPEIAPQKLRDWKATTPPGGESWADFEARVHRAFEQIRGGPRPAAIVAHAAVNHVIGGVNQPYGGVHEL
jgi:alpha-ribazole phosphatase